jgi:hypothetical protein
MLVAYRLQNKRLDVFTGIGGKIWHHHMLGGPCFFGHGVADDAVAVQGIARKAKSIGRRRYGVDRDTQVANCLAARGD